ncbi:hypothetical protein NDU88_002179 [Pleurodeles waltl]|uniref:Uncharacterized protein n=1 Tax=Pleurodeles waltl TaxID=8319 RepID=A0AAV7WPG4_PLEWA|nr:hypothetical protein NDU88_002179 [Pleurodeles waltl]
MPSCKGTVKLCQALCSLIRAILPQTPVAQCSSSLSSMRGKRNQKRKKGKTTGKPNLARFQLPITAVITSSAAAALPPPPAAELRGRVKNKDGPKFAVARFIPPRPPRPFTFFSLPLRAQPRERKTSRSRGKLTACQAAPPRTPRPPFLRLPWWAELRERSYADADAMLPLPHE